MSLVADNISIDTAELTEFDLSAALGRWRYCSPSSFLHHGRPCCSIAREWLFSTDHSQLNGESNLMGPRWLRRKYEWGPSQWPMSWCYAIEQEKLDCGALAALSREVFAARGIRCHAVQLIQKYTEDTTEHWLKEWSDYPASTHWINGELIYHEACAVEVAQNEIRVWDPSSGWWANPKHVGGYAAVCAVRVMTSPAENKTIRWGDHNLAGGTWQVIGGNQLSQTPVVTALPDMDLTSAAISFCEREVALAGATQAGVDLEP
jgi:hypothetical protein